MLVTMANYWSRQHNVRIVLLRKDRVEHEFAPDPRVAISRLDLIEETTPMRQGANLSRLVKLRHHLASLRPRVVIPFIDKLNVAVIFALIGTGIPVVATEHIAPSLNFIGTGWQGLRALAYGQAAMVVSPTNVMTRWFQTRMPGRFVTVPFPADTEELLTQPRGREKLWCLAAGRLSWEKAFDLLIPAFGRVANLLPDWTLMIAGEGRDRPKLEGMIHDAGLEGKVRLAGFCPDLRRYLLSAAVFVMSSRREAYPMVLCEALAAGCAVVATDCPTGPREILRGGVDGLLIANNDIQAMSSALLLVCRNSALRRELGDRGRNRAKTLRSSEVLRLWDSLLDEVTPSCV